VKREQIYVMSLSSRAKNLKLTDLARAISQLSNGLIKQLKRSVKTLVMLQLLAPLPPQLPKSPSSALSQIITRTRIKCH